MSSVADFFHMGGYAFYVWASYGLTTICLTGIVVWSILQHKKVRQQALRRALAADKRDSR